MRTTVDLDEKMVKAKASRPRWAGRDLPFPILLDATGETIKQYDVHAFPTTILIDPEGRLVADGHGELLQVLKDALAKEKAGAAEPPARKQNE